jgi:transcription initiation factor TFIIIB Brf1 subunit/transcription initiation factor TFIIB
MTDTNLESTMCPVCGSDSIIYWDGIDSLICDECSHVIDSESDISGMENSIETATAHEQNVSSEHSDWKTQVSVQDNSEANLVDALLQAEIVATDLSLSDDVVVRIGEVVTSAWKLNFMHGRTMPKLVGAAVYAVSREQDVTVPPGVIAEMMDEEKLGIKKTYTQLKDELQLKLDPPTPAEYVDYICQSLSLPEIVATESVCLLQSTEAVGGNPVGTAGASVYEVSTVNSENITFRQVAQATALAKETVWRHAEKLRESDNIN